MTLRLFVGDLPGEPVAPRAGAAVPAAALPGGVLAVGAEIDLPAAAARHAQVRRVQPGDALLLFDGRGGDWPATVLAMGRGGAVRVRLGAPQPVARELPQAVTLAVGMPANERMDALVEKATELGVAAIQPLLTTRAVLRLEGERAARRRAHWQGVAVAASEQCGRSVVPLVHEVQPLSRWLATQAGSGHSSDSGTRWILSPAADAAPLPCRAPPGAVCALSGPEGGFAPEELAAARAAGFAALSLGPRVLRADTAPLALLAWIGLAVP